MTTYLPTSWHPGSIGRYTKGCRCAECIPVGRAGAVERMRRRKIRLASEADPFVCPAGCGARFPTEAGMKIHATKVHPGGAA